MANTAASYTFKILQGSTWQESVVIKNSDLTAMDLTGYTARMQVREDISSTATLLELTTANGYFAIPTPANGTININVPASVTAALPANNDYQIWAYDLEIVNGSYVRRILTGAVLIYPEVTR